MKATECTAALMVLTMNALRTICESGLALVRRRPDATLPPGSGN